MFTIYCISIVLLFFLLLAKYQAQRNFYSYKMTRGALIPTIYKALSENTLHCMVVLKCYFDTVKNKKQMTQCKSIYLKCSHINVHK